MSFLTLPPLKSDFDTERHYIVPRVRTVAGDSVTHLDNALRRVSRALLIGAAGMGKSAALQFVAAHEGAPLLSYADYHPLALPEKFENQTCILLDDVSEPAHLKHLTALAAKFPNAKIWAATHDPRLVQDAFTALELQPFNEREIVSLAEAWFPRPEKHGSRTNRAAQDFVASVQANAGTRELALTPLLLFLLIQVYQPASRPEQQTVPTEKVALPVVGGDGVARTIEGGPSMRAKPPGGAATPFDVPQRANVSPLPTRRAELFDAYVRARLKSEPDPDFAARALEGIALSTKRGQRAQQDHMARGYGFLVERPGGRIEFKHALLQDYFAARALRRAKGITPTVNRAESVMTFDNPDFAPMRKQLADPAWRQVALFYAGLGAADDVVNFAVETNDLEFAAAALAATGEAAPAHLEQVVKELAARVWDNQDENSLQALGSLRSNPASDFFAAKLRDKDPAVRERAAYVLGKLHTDRALEYLLPQLRDPGDSVRVQVIASLGQSRSERVVEPLLVALRGDPRVPSTDTRMKIAAAQALGEYGTDKAVPALLVDLQVSPPDVRAEAAAAIKKIRSDFAVKPLQSIAATDKHPEVREAAAQVLSDMQGK